MAFAKINEVLEKEWIGKINEGWVNYVQENRMKFAMQTNEETIQFFEELTFKGITYSQVEEGIIDDSYTIRYFNLIISSVGEELEITSAEILGAGFSEWKIEAETIFTNNGMRDDYRLEHQNGTDFKYWFKMTLEENYIQKVFQRFHLLRKCEEFEKEFLHEDQKREELEYSKFFTEEKIEKVFYTSRGIVFKTADGKEKEIKLDPTVYINHFS